MALTAEQKAAHDNLSNAIERVLKTQGGLPEGSVMCEFFTIVEGMRMDDDGDMIPDYAMIFKGGQIRLTVALGLLQVAESRLWEGEAPDTDDE